MEEGFLSFWAQGIEKTAFTGSKEKKKRGDEQDRGVIACCLQ